jgi:phospholipid-binding lipoprotein MlaA
VTAARRTAAAALLLAAALLGGCATTGSPAGTGAAGAGAPPRAANPADPWEGFNRRMFAFNDAVDDAVLRPVATAYRDVVPSFVRTGIGNFLGNVGDVWSTVNHLLQGKVQTGAEMGMRVLTNTLLGMAGLLDPATEMGLTRRSEDFGQTLGRWGMGPGPYLVLPLFGPSTLRDATDRVVGNEFSAGSLPPSDAGRYVITALQVVHTRAGLLDATTLLGEIALDRYSLVRDGYLQRRLSAVYDGSPPMQFDDPGDDAPATPPASPAPPPAPTRTR